MPCDDSSSSDLLMGNETARTSREFKSIVPVSLKRMLDAEGMRPRMIGSEPVLVDGRNDLQRCNMGAGAVLSSNGGEAALKLLDRQEKQPREGFVEDDVCSTSGKENAKSFWKALERCIAASIKGFVIGGGLRGGLSLFAILSRMRKKSSFRSRFQILCVGWSLPLCNSQLLEKEIIL
jgi:hypothetical protein